MKIKGLCFDFDGLILDTEYPRFLAWQEIYQQHGVDFSIQDMSQIIGTEKGAHVVAQHLVERCGQELDIECLVDQYRERILEIVFLKELRPGVAEYLQTANEMGLKLALTTSSPQNWSMPFLKKFGIDRYFDAFCTGTDVGRSRLKPDPAIYLLAVKRLGLMPDEIAAFEDSGPGVTAAQRAGIYSVAVPNELTRHYDLSFADRKIDSMADVSLVDLLGEIEQGDLVL